MRSFILLLPVLLAMIGLAVAAPILESLSSTLNKAVLKVGEEIADPPVLNARERSYSPFALKARKDMDDSIVLDVGKIIDDPPVLNA